MSKNLDEVVEFIHGLERANLAYELKKLNAIKQWAVNSLPIDYVVGDAVKIISPKPSQNGGGWECYSEALAVGRQGTVDQIDFNVTGDRWNVWFTMTDAWSTSTLVHLGQKTKRFWYGSVEDTPQGFEPPTPYDQVHHPNGKPKTFCFRPEWLTKA